MISHICLGGRTKLVVLSSTIIMLSYSCFKQKAPQATIPYPTVITQTERIGSCSDTSLLFNLMSRENLEAMFLCMGWDQNFPRLFAALSNIDSNQWNSFFFEINRRIFNNSDKLKTFIHLIKVLDEKDNLASLEMAMASFHETNIYDVIFSLFQCAENGPCENRPLIDKADVQAVLQHIQINDVMFGRIVDIIDDIVASLRTAPPYPQTASLNVDNVIDIIDGTLDFFSSPRNLLYRNNIKNAIYLDDGANFGALLRREGTKEGIIDVVEKISAEEMSLYKDGIAALKVIDEGAIACGDQESAFQIMPTAYLGMQLEQIRGRNDVEFRSFLVEEMILDSYAIIFCPSAYEIDVQIPFQKRTIAHRLDVRRFKESLLQTFDDQPSFELLKYFVTHFAPARTNK